MSRDLDHPRSGLRRGTLAMRSCCQPRFRCSLTSERSSSGGPDHTQALTPVMSQIIQSYSNICYQIVLFSIHIHSFSATIFGIPYPTHSPKLNVFITRLEAPSQVPLPSIQLIHKWAAEYEPHLKHVVCSFVFMPTFTLI